MDRAVPIEVCLRFYAELNDLLPPARKGGCIVQSLATAASLKDVIEALGVPHTEVDLILVNGESAGFSRLVQDGDRISVYPLFRSIDIAFLTRVRAESLAGKRFVLDTHLGKLAAYLRMLGFDALYRNDYQDAELACISTDEERILLTRDRGLVKRATITHGYLLRETNPRRQLLEVLRRFSLFGSIAAFRRCVHCNTLLQPASLESIRDQLPPKTRQYYQEFRTCPECGRIYWKGSHYQRMQRFVERIMESKMGTTVPLV
jgi:uncharacterized protein with PIN domain